ncbi:MAG TPA: hypothetical protein VK975_03210 [Acidimicrobiales bacterium]|nr:hypothetical protein [Acidimicrobiales bacterium]
MVSLVGKLQADLNLTLEAWARWAQEMAAMWPADLKGAPARELAGGVDHTDGPHSPPPGYDETKG